MAGYFRVLGEFFAAVLQSALMVGGIILIFWALGAVNGCTVTYEPETKACMIRFDPSAEQIKAVGAVCMDVVRTIHDKPVNVEIETEDSGI